MMFDFQEAERKKLLRKYASKFVPVEVKDGGVVMVLEDLLRRWGCIMRDGKIVGVKPGFAFNRDTGEIRELNTGGDVVLIGTPKRSEKFGAVRKDMESPPKLVVLKSNVFAQSCDGGYVNEHHLRETIELKRMKNKRHRIGDCVSCKTRFTSRIEGRGF